MAHWGLLLSKYEKYPEIIMIVVQSDKFKYIPLGIHWPDEFIRNRKIVREEGAVMIFISGIVDNHFIVFISRWRDSGAVDSDEAKIKEARGEENFLEKFIWAGV